MGLFSRKINEVKLGFSSCSDVMADGNSFLFSLESLGLSSSKGFLLSISGDAVDDGSIKFDKIELHRLKGVKFEVTKYGLKKIEKKEGGYAYQLSLRNFDIPQGETESFSIFKAKGDKTKAGLCRIENEIQFKLNVTYTGNKKSEVLLGVFPYENIINGAVTRWIDVSPDKDYFRKIYENQKKR